MFCPKCGKAVREGAKFCNHCGFNLEQSYSYDDDFDEEDGRYEEKGKRKKSRYWLVPLIMFLILAAGIGVAFAILKFLPAQTSIFPWQNLAQTIEATEVETKPEIVEQESPKIVTRQKLRREEEKTETAFDVDRIAPAALEESETIEPELEETLEETKQSEPESTMEQNMLEEEEYILPDSSSRYLTEADLVGLTKEELRLARNEIYARHGRIFTSDDLGGYFSSKSWYRGTIPASDFSEDLLSKVEKDNIKLIKQMEEKLS